MSRLMPRFFVKSHDGGKDSGVTGYWLIEWKPVFSIVLLRFSEGTREAYHTHAFNALTMWLKGKVREDIMVDDRVYSKEWQAGNTKVTPRNLKHRICGLTKSAWALSFRGPWLDTWTEHKHCVDYTLTHGRKVVPQAR